MKQSYLSLVRRRRLGIVTLTVIMVLLARLPARALPADRSMQQLEHRAWTYADGAPSAISSLAQTQDGLLWLGTEEGLVRFDGIHFLRFDPTSGAPYPDSPVHDLYADPQGGLWIGYQLSGISYLKAGDMITYGEAEGLPFSAILAAFRDRSGELWVSVNNHGLYRLEGKRFVQVLAAGTVCCFLEDRVGALWLGTLHGLLRRPPGVSAFSPVPGASGNFYALTQAADGKIWAADATEAVYVFDAQADGANKILTLQLKSAGLASDPDGSYWITTLGGGLRRLKQIPVGGGMIAADSSQLDAYTEADGLSGNYAWPILFDREGNLWVGTSKGLDRFREQPLVPAVMPGGAHDFAMAPDDSGSVWVGTTNQPLLRSDGSGFTFAPAVPPEVTCVYRSRDGAIWLGGNHGIYHLLDGQAALVAPLPAGMAANNQVQSMATDAQGVLWVSITGQNGLERWADGSWTHLANPHGLSDKSRPWIQLVDSNGKIWRGYPKGGLTVTDDHTTWIVSPDNDSGLGNILALAEGRGGVWVGAEQGLYFYDGTKFRRVEAAGIKLMLGVSGIVDTGSDGLWFRAQAGVLHIGQSELDRWRTAPNLEVAADVFDAFDGLQGPSSHYLPLPTMTQGSDGRIWLATAAGVSWILPRRIHHNRIPPVVTLDALNSGGRLYTPGTDPELPKGSTQIQIDYTTASLAVPERVHFHYWLEGVDPDWVDAGTRRQAYYTNLGPGRYVFKVTAANDDGVWSTEPASFAFVIAPRFDQTRWFALLCAALAFGGLWGVYQMRVRHLVRHMKIRFQERLAERERIARELHDTLLQGIQGLILQFQGALSRLSNDEPAYSPLKEALKHANDMLIEGRERVRGLRRVPKESVSLADGFVALARELSQGKSIDLRVVIEGSEVGLNTLALDEVNRIVGEGLTNAFSHSAATEIHLLITYEPRCLTIRLRDNGIGISPEVMKDGQRVGHWGLLGMRERAASIRGRLAISTYPGGGTEMELIVPGSVAYQQGIAKSAWHRMLERLDAARGWRTQ